MAQLIKKGVTFYTAGTPNGWKVSVLLKELKYPHVIKPISISKNEQKEDWFLKINPNGRIPAIVDHDNDDYPVFESGAIMMYLADKAKQLYPEDWNKRSEVNQWLFFMNAGVGPMQGQLNHFVRFAPVKLEYPQQRYLNETKRLYSVLEDRLKDHEWLAADEYTIADIATVCWVMCAPFAGVSLGEFPKVETWVQKIYEREAVKEGLNVPEPSKLLEAFSSPEAMSTMLEDAKALMVSSAD